MADFTAYSDESEVGDANRTFITAGYADLGTNWEFFENAWQRRVLDGPPTIPYLHMTEIRSARWRAKHGISWWDAESRIDEAVRVIASTGSLSFIVSTLERKDLEETIQARFADRGEILPEALKRPDYLPFLAYAEFTVAQLYRKRSDVSRVNFVAEEKEKVTHHLKHIHADLIRLVESPLKGRIGEFKPGRKETVVPLQAADLLCWHIQRYYVAASKAGTSLPRLEPTDNRRFDKLMRTTGYRHNYTSEDLRYMAEKLLNP